jgi:hypothetical protein
MTKERLLEYLRACGLVDSAMDLYQQQEFVRLIGHFFDRALCYTGEGYEWQAHANRRRTRTQRSDRREETGYMQAHTGMLTLVLEMEAVRTSATFVS